MGFVGGNVQEYVGGARGFPHTGDGSECQAAEVRYLDKSGSGKGTQGSGNLDTGNVHLQAAGKSDGVDGVESDT